MRPDGPEVPRAACVGYRPLSCQRARRPRRWGHPCARGARRAFTLVEAAIVTVIIGVGVVAMLELLASGTMVNAEGAELTTAVNLAHHVREITLGMSFRDPEQPTQWSTREASLAAFDDVLDLDGQSFSPPVDARRVALSGYDNWAQAVAVDSVARTNLASTVTDTVAQPTARVTVTIRHHGQAVYQVSWLAVAPNGS